MSMLTPELRLATLLALVSLVALPATPTSASTALPPRLGEGAAEARSQLSRVDAALDGTLSGLVGAGHEAAGLPPPSPVTAPEVVPDGVPGPLGPALAPLVGAVEQAERLLEPSVRRARAEFGSSLPSLTEILQDPESYDGPLFDPGHGLKAAAVIAAGIEAAVPRLRAVAAASPPGLDGDGCDVVDLAPALCVGGVGANLYEEDAVILVDLGGDDTHLHGAGEGNPLISRRQPAVGLTLDLGGNDRYLAVDPDRSGAQGLGTAGAGFLVDLAGDDTYGVLTNPRPEGGWSGSLGQGSGALGGVGVLADLGGDDRYELRSENAAPSYGTSSLGQASGVLGGVGLLLDADGGRDEYAARSTTRLIAGENGVAPYSGAYAFAQAEAALAGASVLADDGGDATFTVESRVLPPPPGTPIGKEQSNTLPYADAQGQGWATGLLDVGAAAFLVTGPGDTDYTLRAVSDLPLDLSDEVDPIFIRDSGFRLARAQGQGYGAVAGIGALHDRGGDDRYAVEAASLTEAESVAPEGCACQALEARAVTWGAVAMGQGVGATDAAGLLRDEGGNDTYGLAARAEAEAVVRDEGGLQHGASATAFALAGSVQTSGQGHGIVDGTGALEDAGGNDTYTAAADSRAVARAEAPGGAPASEAISGYADTQAQGAALGVQGTNVYAFGGTGILRDLGGYDSYEATASSEAASSPDEEATDAYEVFTSAQGSVEGLTGLGLHIDDGGTDRYVTRPEDPTCEGTRGEDVWHDCGTVGLGMNR